MQACREISRATGMIDVTMGQQDFREFDALLLGGCEDAVDVATGVDSGGFQGFFTPQQGAVLLEGGDGMILYFM